METNQSKQVHHTGYEKLLLSKKLNGIVVGDVNSTMACTMLQKNNIPVAHVEAGIRSGDMTMPEEINRIVTDSISDYFLLQHKKQEVTSKGFPRIKHIGRNTMIDTLYRYRSKFKNLKYGTN